MGNLPRDGYRCLVIDAPLAVCWHRACYRLTSPGAQRAHVEAPRGKRRPLERMLVHSRLEINTRCQGKLTTLGVGSATGPAAVGSPDSTDGGIAESPHGGTTKVFFVSPVACTNHAARRHTKNLCAACISHLNRKGNVCIAPVPTGAWPILSTNPAPNIKVRRA